MRWNLNNLEKGKYFLASLLNLTFLSHILGCCSSESYRHYNDRLRDACLKFLSSFVCSYKLKREINLDFLKGSKKGSEISPKLSRIFPTIMSIDVRIQICYSNCSQFCLSFRERKCTFGAFGKSLTLLYCGAVNVFYILYSSTRDNILFFYLLHIEWITLG